MESYKGGSHTVWDCKYHREHAKLGELGSLLEIFSGDWPKAWIPLSKRLLQFFV
jgi:hypothetical protein